MKNPLSLKVESLLGSIFVLTLSAFFVGLMLIAVKNFNSDNEILGMSNSKIRLISIQERKLIDEWLVRNNIGLSAQEVGYRYIVRKYPAKPWAAD